MVSGGRAADRSILADVPAWFYFFKPRFCFVFLFVFTAAVLRGQCMGTVPCDRTPFIEAVCFFGRILAGVFPLFGLRRNFVHTATAGRFACRERSRLATCIYLVCQYAKGAFVVVMAILVYGAWNAVHPVVREVEHDTGKNLPQPVKIVLVTDIHLGSLFGRQYAVELTELINRQNADVVLFGGDQVDNSLTYLLREKSYEPLQNIKSKYGVYGILGNHDHFDNPYLEKLAGTDPGKANLLLEHQPRRFWEAEKAGYDLYMAGHTHGGQQAPLNFVTKRMYLLDYGSKKFGNMLGITSCGYGLWGSPVRIGSTPEIVVITLK